MIYLAADVANESSGMGGIGAVVMIAILAILFGMSAPRM